MPKQRYLAKWEDDFDKQAVDGVKVKIGQWAKKKDDYHGACVFCNKTIYVGAMGKAALIQHASREKHLSLLAAMQKQPPVSVNKEKRPLNLSDASLRAEMRWSAFIAEHDLPLNISINSAELFQNMFPDSEIAQRFSCGRTKASYLISDAFEPVLRSELVEDLQSHHFSVLIDESNKTFGNKYLNILVKYFKSGEIITRFYRSILVKEGTAEELVNAINASFVSDNISWKKVLQVMSDSPHLMRGSKNGVIAKIKQRYAPNMVDIGGCSLHYVHNAISYATEALGEDIENFVVDVYAFFKYRTGLVQEFHDIQALLDIPEHQILRFVSTRWLSMLPVVNRLLEQWDALTCFFESLKKKHPDVAKQDRAKRILLCLKDDIILAKMRFLSVTLPKFEAFEKLFQSSGGMIHLLHMEMCELLKTTMAQFVKPQLLENVSTTSSLLKVQFEEIANQLSDKDLPIGQETEKCLKNATREEKKLFMLDIRKFYKVVTRKMIGYFHLDSRTLQDIQFLNPDAQKRSEGLTAVKRIASSFKALNEEIIIEKVEEEWLRYSVENYEVERTRSENDIVAYWNAVLSDKYPTGESKFEHLAIIVFMSLSLAHGNADTERSFSRVSRILTKSRTLLGIHSLNGLMAINSEMDQTKSKAHSININERRLKFGQDAYANYTRRQENGKNHSDKKKLNEEIQVLTEVLQHTKKVQDKTKIIEDALKFKEDLQKKIDHSLKEAMDAMKKISKTEKEVTKQQEEVKKMEAKFEMRTKKRSQASVSSISDAPRSKQAKLTDVFSKSATSKSDENISADNGAKIKSRIGHQRRIDNIKGDGNCFFRALAKEVFGKEESHVHVREMLVDFMNAHKETFDIYIDADKEDHRSKMKRSGTWATQAELFAAASFFNRDIFVLTPIQGEYKWCLFAAKGKHKSLIKTCSCHIALCNTNGCHYDRIVAVSEKCNCGLKRPSLGV